MTTKTFAFGLVLVAGCLKANPNYLSPDGNNGSNGSGGSNGSDGGMGSGCTPSSCSGMTPVCEANGSCGPCRSDADCSDTTPTCLPSGACDGDTDLAYVTGSGSDTNACTIEAPCATVTHAMTVKSTVVLTGSANDDGVSLAQGSDITILGRGSAMITRTMTLGAAVSISAGDVSLYDITLTGAGPTQGDGVLASTTGTVDLERVTLTMNPHYGINASAGKIIANRSEIDHNQAGGVWLDTADFDLENCVIFSNGVSGTSAFGGVDITSPPTTAKLEFTTIADNHALTTQSGGVVCSGAALMLSDDIVYGNDTYLSVQTLGTCSFTYTDFYPTGFFAGSGNGSGDPMFAGSDTGDFHIGASSAAKDAADPNASLKIDFYGSARPVGAGYDMGASEFQ
jgi:hypothetical protein